MTTKDEIHYVQSINADKRVVWETWLEYIKNPNYDLSLANWLLSVSSKLTMMLHGVDICQ